MVIKKNSNNERCEKWRENNREKYLKYKREWTREKRLKNPEFKREETIKKCQKYYKDPDIRKKRSDYMKKYYQKNKEKIKKKQLEYYHLPKNKEKNKSRGITDRFFNKYPNFIPIMCFKCKGTKKLEIHHDVYPITLEQTIMAIKNKKIYYLCFSCHRKIHRKYYSITFKT